MNLFTRRARAASLAMMLGLLIAACSKQDPTGMPTEEPVVTDTAAPAAEVYTGSRGLVVDTRPLFRRGYRPTTVEIAFPDYPRFDQALEVDPITNLATFAVENDSLSEAEQDAFASGLVQVDIVVRGEDPGAAGPALTVGGPARTNHVVELASSTAPRSVDASNQPVAVDDPTLPERAPPLEITAGMPYLIVPDGGANTAVTQASTGCPSCLTRLDWPYFSPSIESDTTRGQTRRRQDFYFSPTDNDTYTIQLLSDAPLGTFLIADTLADTVSTSPLVIRPIVQLAGGAASNAVPLTNGSGEFELIQEPGARVRIRDVATGLYLGTPLAGTTTQSWALDSLGAHFRLLAPEVELSIDNLGTSFNQPIIPPARVAFASQSTIRNCSAATVQEIVGRSEVRELTKSFSTTDNVQWVSSDENRLSATVALNFQATYEPPEEAGGIMKDVNIEYSHQWDSTFTTTELYDTTRTTSADTTEAVEITREREVTVGPFSAVTVIDWVRTIENLTVPWTQTLRIRGRNSRTGDPVSGGELVSMLRFNRVDAVPVAVSTTFVDITLRGSTTADNLYQTEVNAFDVQNACN
jgi:hypothetical protein